LDRNDFNFLTSLGCDHILKQIRYRRNNINRRHRQKKLERER